MKGKWRTAAILCAAFFLLGLGGCSESGPVPEEMTSASEKEYGATVGTAKGFSASFDTGKAQRMAGFMGGNRAVIAENMLYSLEFAENYAPVLASYEIVDGRPMRFSILAEDCVPRYLALSGDRLFYINGNGSSSLESVNTGGSDRQVLIEEPCDCLQLWEDSLYFCDASGRFCRAGLDGGDKTVLIDDVCFYAYYIEGFVLYQSGSDGESLHLRELASGEDTKLTSTVSYAPVLIDDTLWYTQKTEEGSRVCSLELDTGFTRTDDFLIRGAAEFIYDEELGWCARAVPADERLEQSVIPLSALGDETWTQCGYSGYRLCEWSELVRIDAAYENGGRLRSFVLVYPNGGETEYMAGQTREK